MATKNKNHLEQEMIIQKIVRIQTGNGSLRNAFLSNYHPFILKFTAKTCKGLKDIENSEQYQIAFTAFDEAINTYQIDQDGFFIDYAKNRMSICLSKTQQDPMQELKSNLLQFGIKITDLVKGSPKDIDSRRICIYIAKMIMEDPNVQNKLIGRRKLPVKYISKQTSIELATIYPYRKYICALWLIMRSRNVGLQDYLDQFLEEVKTNAHVRSRH